MGDYRVRIVRESYRYGPVNIRLQDEPRLSDLSSQAFEQTTGSILHDLRKVVRGGLRIARTVTDPDLALVKHGLLMSLIVLVTGVASDDVGLLVGFGDANDESVAQLCLALNAMDGRTDVAVDRAIHACRVEPTSACL